jgi:DNA-binding FrmR family transcriptional regulator
MAHTTHDKKKLLNRVQRIRGQVDAVARSLESEEDCAETLRLIAACRGAMNSLLSEVLEGHIRFHVVDPKIAAAARTDAGEQLIDIVRAYLK